LASSMLSATPPFGPGVGGRSKGSHAGGDG
jgi:hypothetical protein